MCHCVLTPSVPDVSCGGQDNTVYPITNPTLIVFKLMYSDQTIIYKHLYHQDRNVAYEQGLFITFYKYIFFICSDKCSF